jgi:hypothetical protein
MTLLSFSLEKRPSLSVVAIPPMAAGSPKGDGKTLEIAFLPT